MPNPAFDEVRDSFAEADEDSDTGTESTSEAGDGDGDGDPSTGDGDGDDDPITGDGDGDVPTGDGDGDAPTGDGDGDGDDPITGDGDGDPAGDPFTRTVFVTSEWYTGDLGGIPGADQHCLLAAASAGLEGTYWAWLSTHDNSPAQSFDMGGLFALPSGTVVAESWAQLTSGELLHAIDEDPFGWPAAGPPGCAPGTMAVWMGTMSDGGPTPTHCNSWTNTELMGRVGYLGTTDASWTAAPCTVSCAEAHPILCFEQL